MMPLDCVAFLLAVFTLSRIFAGVEASGSDGLEISCFPTRHLSTLCKMSYKWLCPL